MTTAETLMLVAVFVIAGRTWWALRSAGRKRPPR